MQDCFFCMKSHNKVPMYATAIPDKNINSIDEFVDVIRTRDFEGVGFSGGEPFLYFTDMLYCVKELKKLPKPIYVWAYTSGDFVTPDTLQYLKKAGLDELRFNIAARGYDISPVAIAGKYFNNVSIETPAIPDHGPIIMSLILELIECNVKFLNLHELHVGDYNRQKIIDSGFSIENNIVLGSEKTALDIIDFVDTEHLPIFVNYCSYKYKTNRTKVNRGI